MMPKSIIHQNHPLQVILTKHLHHISSWMLFRDMLKKLTTSSSFHQLALLPIGRFSGNGAPIHLVAQSETWMSPQLLLPKEKELLSESNKSWQSVLPKVFGMYSLFSTPPTIILVYTIIDSHLDFNNSFLTGLPASNLKPSESSFCPIDRGSL